MMGNRQISNNNKRLFFGPKIATAYIALLDFPVIAASHFKLSWILMNCLLLKFENLASASHKKRWNSWGIRVLLPAHRMVCCINEFLFPRFHNDRGHESYRSSRHNLPPFSTSVSWRQNFRPRRTSLENVRPFSLGPWIPHDEFFSLSLRTLSWTQKRFPEKKRDQFLIKSHFISHIIRLHYEHTYTVHIRTFWETVKKIRAVRKK